MFCGWLVSLVVGLLRFLNCGTNEELWSKGLYKRVRSVVDVTDVYYLVAEYMDCRSCQGTFVAWHLRILNQLPEGVRALALPSRTHVQDA